MQMVKTQPFYMITVNYVNLLEKELVVITLDLLILTKVEVTLLKNENR